jgi:uncharacterized protein (DUF1015 family)
MSVVRPFRARVVRQTYAEKTVTQMLDALPAAERPSRDEHRDPLPIDPAAYDESPMALFAYRLRRGDEQHVGVVGEVRADAFLDGRVRGHEAVQPERVDALVDLYTSGAVRSELVALLHRPGPEFTAAMAETLGSQPLIQFTGPDAWEQTVWRVSAAMTEQLTEELGRRVHYIADGHHRVAASVAVWKRDGQPSTSGVMCVMYPLDGLRLLSFHRRLSGPVRADELLALVFETFEVREIDPLDEATGSFGLYVDGRWHDATYKGARPPGAAGLDLAILNDRVLEPIARATNGGSRVEIASAHSSREELTKACDQDGGAFFALRPPTLDQLTDVADRGEVMPPKTTYFDPKPYAGIFLR